MNPLVAAGIIPSHILESFVIPAAKEQTHTLPKVITKSRWLTSDEHIKLYKEKLEKLKKDKAKEKRKAEREQGMLEKDLECRRGGARTRGGITRLTNQRTQRKTIKTSGGKQGSFFRPAEKESKEEHSRYKSVNTPEEGHKRSSKNE